MSETVHTRKSAPWLRRYVSAGILFTFIVVGVTGVIFQFFFKNKVLESIHGWLGVAMVVVAIFHVVQNWKPLLNHCRDRYVFALLIPVCAAMAFFAYGQNQGGAPGGRGMNPRMIIGKLTNAKASDLAKTFGKDMSSVAKTMKTDHLIVTSADETVADMAKANGKSPEALLSYFIN